MLPSGVLASTEMPHIRGLEKGAIIPIADLPADSKYSKMETKLRNQLASLYRLVDKFHWSQAIYNHMTVRIPNENGMDEIIINPFGFSYHEVTASSLVKVDLKGHVIDQGTTNNSINQAGYVLHSAIHEGRRDIQAVLHLHTPSVAAVSSMKCGLLPVCQEAMILGPVAYHEYQGILVDDDERLSLVSDLGDKNIMILRNHGFVVCGKTIEEAFITMYHLILACETQVRALSCGGVEHLHIPTKEAAHRAYSTAQNGAGGVNREKNGCVRNDRWGKGELEWQAWMRSLDAMGLSTGYSYRQI